VCVYWGEMAASPPTLFPFVRKITDTRSRIATACSFVVIGVDMRFEVFWNEEKTRGMPHISLAMFSDNGKELIINSPAPSEYAPDMRADDPYYRYTDDHKTDHDNPMYNPQYIDEYLLTVRGDDRKDHGIVFVVHDQLETRQLAVWNLVLGDCKDRQKMYICDLYAVDLLYQVMLPGAPVVRRSYNEMYRSVFPESSLDGFDGFAPFMLAFLYLKTAARIGYNLCINHCDPLEGTGVLWKIHEETKDYREPASLFLATCCETFHQLGWTNIRLSHSGETVLLDGLFHYVVTDRVDYLHLTATDKQGEYETIYHLPLVLSMIYNTYAEKAPVVEDGKEKKTERKGVIISDEEDEEEEEEEEKKKGRTTPITRETQKELVITGVLFNNDRDDVLKKEVELLITAFIEEYT
jgi:hypothetical protein